jgi:phytoene synthase
VGRYRTYADLLDYCRRSANPIGRLLLALYRQEVPANRDASDAICTGLQLTNFWQDVAGDWRRGRVYLPEEDLARFGVTTEQIASQHTDERWRALLAFEVARARGLLESGRPLTRALPWRLGLELSAVIAGGLRILARIDAVGGDVFRRRPVLGPRDWCVVALNAVRPARTSA